jgi:hypothetical protein
VDPRGAAVVINIAHATAEGISLVRRAFSRIAAVQMHDKYYIICRVRGSEIGKPFQLFDVAE